MRKFDSFITDMPYKDKEKQKEFQRLNHQANKDKWRARNSKRRKEDWEWFREITKDILCKVCGEKERCCLDFHHLIPEEKYDEVTQMVNSHRSRGKIMLELSKCIVLCSNCHRKYHAGLITL